MVVSPGPSRTKLRQAARRRFRWHREIAAARPGQRRVLLALCSLCAAWRCSDAAARWQASRGLEQLSRAPIAFVRRPPGARLERLVPGRPRQGTLAHRPPCSAAAEQQDIAVAQRPEGSTESRERHVESQSEVAAEDAASKVAAAESKEPLPTWLVACLSLLLGLVLGVLALGGPSALQKTTVREQSASSNVPKVKVEPGQKQTLEGDAKIAKAYTQLMETARNTGTKLQNVVQSFAFSGQKEAPKRVSPSIVKMIRDVGDILNEMQSDVYGEEWRSLEVYPNILRAYLPLMDYYPVQAFPENGNFGKDSEKQVRAATRDSLEFETKQFNTGLARLEKAISSRKVREVEEAFAKTSLSYDRYLKAGDLYTGYDPVTSTTVFFRDVKDSQLQYTPLALQQPQIRDEVLVLQGPDKGKVGRIIWLGREDGNDLNSKVLSAVVKLDPNPVLGKSRSGGVQEVKAYPYAWLVMTRDSSANYVQDLFLATLAAVVSCAVTFPLETIKARAQMNQSPIPPEGPQALFNGVWLNVLREAPNAGFLMAGFNYLTRQAVSLPFINGNDTNLKFFLMIPSGILAMCSGAFVKVPVIDISKQVQAGVAADTQEAIQNVYFKPSRQQVDKKLARTFMLTIIRGVPFGAFQCLIYEVLKDKTPPFLESMNVPIALEPFIWGGVAGFCTGYLTNPPDVVMQRLSVDTSDLSSSGSEDKAFDFGETWEEIVKATEKVYRDEGWGGFAKGGFENALYFAPEAMVWFGVYEALKGFVNGGGVGS
eukprot:TRINITY_DN111919_c0_g1_i1.p1 TRINITY_DN111919_c0_g1~~TRINITY_DN111919_c0_g1_i1.p1  ORF type:complete len:767 (+),score=156.82 TRINITY_DN111919_c0_g1_i1:28-2328(+)